MDFIHWVKSDETVARGEWYRSVSEDGNEEWIPQARELVRSLAFRESVITPAQLSRMWKAIDKATDVPQASAEKPTIRRFHIGRWAAAASVLLLLGAAIWLIPQYFDGQSITTTTALAQTSDVALPDGSSAQLNASSSLSYSNEAWEEERLVKLSGEAFFQVKKGEKFTVKTDRGQVQVLGTSFNVFDRDGDFHVTCHTGKVRVNTGDQEVILSPGTKCHLIDGQLVKSDIQIDPGKTWMQGYFLYDNEGLDNVFAEVERQFDVKVDYTRINNNRRYSGFFISNDLEKALQSICWPLRLTYKIEGKNVTIYQED